MDWKDGGWGTVGERKWEERGEDEQRSSLDEATAGFAGLSLHAELRVSPFHFNSVAFA